MPLDTLPFISLDWCAGVRCLMPFGQQEQLIGKINHLADHHNTVILVEAHGAHALRASVGQRYLSRSRTGSPLLSVF